MKFEETLHIESSAEKIFSLYKDVNNWSTWDPKTKECFIDGEFKVGTMGILKPKNGPKGKFTITEVTENKSFTVKYKLPFCDLYFKNELTPQSPGTEVLHKIVFEGLLAPLWGRIIGNKLKKEQSQTMKALKKVAE